MGASSTRSSSAGTEEPPELQILAAALRVVLTKGLPLVPGQVPEELLALRAVEARTPRPNDFLSRVRALETLVQRLLIAGDSDEDVALRTLFGLPAENRGITLTERRKRAAAVLNYDETHFRKRVEPRLLYRLAWQIYSDELQHVAATQTALRSIRETTPTDTTALDSAEDVAHERLVSLIWSDIYGLRAEILARDLSERDAAERHLGEEAVGAGLWHLARLLTHIRRYTEEYGPSILRGEVEYDVEGLITLAGWNGGFTDHQARALRFMLAQVGEWNRTGFIAMVSDGMASLDKLDVAEDEGGND